MYIGPVYIRAATCSSTITVAWPASCSVSFTARFASNSEGFQRLPLVGALRPRVLVNLNFSNPGSVTNHHSHSGTSRSRS